MTRAQPDGERLLDAAETLFYERGYQAVGMDALREASGLPLKRIYGLYEGKTAIAGAMLARRDERWMAALRSHVESVDGARERVLAIFDWLHRWLDEEGSRGCAWINAFGELGGVSDEVVVAVRSHKTRLRAFIDTVVGDAGAPQETADAVFLLVEGCLVTAGIDGRADAALQARDITVRLLHQAG